MFNISAYTPLESLFLFDSLVNLGVNAPAFSRVSTLLKNNSYIKDCESYDAARLSPESLQELFLHLLRDELKLEDENSDQANGSLPPNRRRKLQTPPLHSLQEAREHLPKVPVLRDRLWLRYKDHKVREIHQDEERFEKEHGQLRAVENGGQWNGGDVGRADKEGAGKEARQPIPEESRQGGQASPGSPGARGVAPLPNGTDTGPTAAAAAAIAATADAASHAQPSSASPTGADTTTSRGRGTRPGPGPGPRAATTTPTPTPIPIPTPAPILSATSTATPTPSPLPQISEARQPSAPPRQLSPTRSVNPPVVSEAVPFTGKLAVPEGLPTSGPASPGPQTPGPAAQSSASPAPVSLPSRVPSTAATRPPTVAVPPRRQPTPAGANFGGVPAPHPPYPPQPTTLQPVRSPQLPRSLPVNGPPNAVPPSPTPPQLAPPVSSGPPAAPPLARVGVAPPSQFGQSVAAAAGHEPPRAPNGAGNPPVLQHPPAQGVPAFSPRPAPSSQPPYLQQENGQGVQGGQGMQAPVSTGKHGKPPAQQQPVAPPAQGPVLRWEAPYQPPGPHGPKTGPQPPWNVPGSAQSEAQASAQSQGVAQGHQAQASPHARYMTPQQQLQQPVLVPPQHVAQHAAQGQLQAPSLGPGQGQGQGQGRPMRSPIPDADPAQQPQRLAPKSPAPESGLVKQPVRRGSKQLGIPPAPPQPVFSPPAVSVSHPPLPARLSAPAAQRPAGASPPIPAHQTQPPPPPPPPPSRPSPAQAAQAVTLSQAPPAPQVAAAAHATQVGQAGSAAKNHRPPPPPSQQSLQKIQPHPSHPTAQGQAHSAPKPHPPPQQPHMLPQTPIPQYQYQHQQQAQPQPYAHGAPPLGPKLGPSNQGPLPLSAALPPSQQSQQTPSYALTQAPVGGRKSYNSPLYSVDKDDRGQGPGPTIPEHLIPGRLITTPGPRRTPILPQTPVNANTGNLCYFSLGSATKWKTGDVTPSTPRGIDVLTTGDIPSPAFEPLSPVLAPVVPAATSATAAPVEPVEPVEPVAPVVRAGSTVPVATKDLSEDELALKMPESSTMPSLQQTLPRSTKKKQQQHQQQAQKIDTSTLTPRPKGRPRGSKARDKQHSPPLTGPGSAPGSQRQRSPPDELQLDADSAKVKREEETPRPPLEETGDTTADESGPSRRQLVAPSSVSSRRGKRKRADSVPPDQAETGAAAPAAPPAVPAPRTPAVPAVEPSSALTPGASTAAATGLASAAGPRPPLGPPSHVLWTRGFPRISASALDQIGSHRHANMFAHQIRDRDAPGYKSIVLGPMDLKSIRAAITHGNKSAVQAAAALPDGGNETGSNSSIWLPISEDLIPPKGIINSAQLDRELVHMFANAIMYNPDPDRGPGPSFMEPDEEDYVDEGGDAGGSGVGVGALGTSSAAGGVVGYKVDENAVVNDTRSMFVEVEKLLSNMRAAEIQRGAPAPPPGATGLSTGDDIVDDGGGGGGDDDADAGVSGAAAVAEDETMDDVHHDHATPSASTPAAASGTGTIKRRRIARG